MENKEYVCETIKRISGVNPLKCMRCGKCTATCPAYDEMDYHPHQFVYMVENGDIEALMSNKSVYKCLTCFACLERCPRQVEPAKLIDAVRAVTVRQKGNNHLKADNVPALLDNDIPQQALVSAFRKYSE